MLKHTIIGVLCTIAIAKSDVDDLHPLANEKIAHFAQPAALADYLLPVTLIPERYDLFLDVFLNSFTFNGEVTIVGAAPNPTNRIVLHSNNLILNTIEVLTDAGDLFADYTLSNDDKHFLTINLNGEIAAGQKANLTIKYTGTLNDLHQGFYKAQYPDPNGEPIWLATTQFESTSAREAFPCFDEPDLKAVFNIKIKRDASLNSVSNAPQLSQTPDGDRVIDSYADTAKMSTYLIAFVVSDYTFIANGNHDVYARKAYIDDGRANYALEASIPILQAMEDLTKVPYQMQKMTQISIPNKYYAAGAMENWGLVTYRDMYLMYKDGISTAGEKEFVATIIAHEYAHQWFGDLVSPKWWTYIWLNEGFATYFEYFAADKVYPEFRFVDQFCATNVQRALQLDIPPNTRPITYEAASPAEIDDLFDIIAYQKAGSVIRMMENFLTTDVFFQGLNVYLNDMAFKGATEDDLYRNIQSVIPQTVSLPAPLDVVMKTWTLQAGYPVVTVIRNADGSINLSQQLFGAVGDSIWQIPINYVTSNDDLTTAFIDTTPSFWLTNSNDVLPNVVLSEGSWIILNKQATGYYRINYGTLWPELIAFLRTTGNMEKIPPTNRAQILDDAFMLAKMSYISYDVLLNLLEYVSLETDFVPLYSFYVGVNDLLKYAPGLERYDLLKTMLLRVLDNVYTKLGTDIKPEDTHTDLLNRVQILRLVCALGHEECLSRMNIILNEQPNTVHPDLQSPVYCGAMRTDAANNLGKLTTLYPNVDDLQKSRIASGMGCSGDAGIISQILNNEVGLGAEDLSSARRSLNSNEVGITATLDWLISLSSQLTSTEIVSTLSPLSSRVVKVEDKAKVEEIISLIDPTGVEANIASIRANIVANEEWFTANQDVINSWLIQNYGTLRTKTAF